nr:hypothetical protein BaRGS_022981 [Batillaria attramentaria]
MFELNHEQGRDDDLPRLLFNANNTQINFVLDKFVPSFNKSRFALEVVMVSQETSDSMYLEETKSIDDEYSPGVFRLWWQFCLKKGGKVEAFNKARGTDYFHMYVQLLRVLEKIEYEDKGTSLRRVVLVDEETYGEERESIWRGPSPSLLAFSRDYIIIGTYFGECLVLFHSKAPPI